MSTPGAVMLKGWSGMWYVPKGFERANYVARPLASDAAREAVVEAALKWRAWTRPDTMSQEAAFMGNAEAIHRLTDLTPMLRLEQAVDAYLARHGGGGEDSNRSSTNPEGDSRDQSQPL